MLPMHDDAVKMLRGIGAIVNVYQHEGETPEKYAGRIGSYVARLRDEHDAATSVLYVVRSNLQQAATDQFLGDDKAARANIASAYRAVLK